MSVAGLQGSDGRSVNEVFGFVSRLAMLSAAHLTDYVVDAGTVAMIGGANTDELIRLCVKVGLLKKCRVDGMTAYKVVDDPDFLHLRLKAEIEWQRQQQADGKNERLTVPIRLRDGDLCRYCGVMVMWLGRPSPNSATFDHLNPGEAATVDTLVVACRGCNSGLRDIAGREHEHLKAAPAEPYYSEFTAEWLNNRGHPDVEPSARPDNQPGTATRRKATRKNTGTTGKRSASQAANAPKNSDSDPAQPDPARTAPGPEVDLQAASEGDPEAIGMDSIGTGRVGQGNDALSSKPTNAGTPRPSPAGTRRRKRSRRGRQHGPPPGGSG